MRHIGRDLGGLAVLILALGAGVFLMLRNNIPPASGDPLATDTPVPTTVAVVVQPTAGDIWGEIIQGEIVNGATPLPTVHIVRPTLEMPTPTPTDLAGPIQWLASPTPTRAASGALTPTRPAPTAVSVAPEGPSISRNPNPRNGEFSPPPELAPLSLDPRDHFWFRRPVDSSANSSEIYWYVYGSDGPTNEWRVHHGVDLPNPDGKEVRAAGDGIVIWAADNYEWKQDGWTDRAYTYGNVVVVQHDFGFQGQRLYTLYAHLSLILVEVGQRVSNGTVVGLSGRSGVVSGPHVHFEVRVERNKYSDTRNPILWMVPYEGHGVIAGRILYANGEPVQDVTVKLWRGSTLIDSTTTYVNPHWTNNQPHWNVNPDEIWRENFVIGDVPAGDYVLTVDVNGVRYRQGVTVRAATTSFVDFNKDMVEPTPSG